MLREEFLRKYGPHIRSIEQTTEFREALEALARKEIENLHVDLLSAVATNNQHDAAMCAGRIEGIKDFFGVVKAFAEEYAASKTST